MDVLDAVVMVGCLGTMSIFPGGGALLVSELRPVPGQEDAATTPRNCSLNAFGKQPRYVWLCRGRRPRSRCRPTSSRRAMSSSCTPARSCRWTAQVVEGMAMIDQHALTGESTPAEKGVGDRVFASTLMVAGEIKVSVEMSGSETASAKISQILSDTAGYKMSSQHKGERLADKAVIPTLGVGALGMATMGPAGAVAVLNSDFGTGIRMAAPLAMLSSLALCASKGILVKDGRALELMNEVDTVLFDKTGTLTRERPEVGRVIAADGWSSEQILGFAAAAERKFHHPIALAILHKADELGLTLPPTDDTQYKVGYGITVQIEGHTIRVGSKRFMEIGGDRDSAAGPRGPRGRRISRGTRWSWWAWTTGSAARSSSRRPSGPRSARSSWACASAESSTSRSSRATTRPPPESSPSRWEWTATSPRCSPPTRPITWRSCRRKGARSASSATGSTTRSRSKKADVSISLRGASSIATDTAHIVFLEGGLSKLCELSDIARDLDRNVNRSWSMIVAPNLANVVGVFTMGFGIMTSVVTNNVSALAALGNGLLPLRKVARAESDRRRDRERTSSEPARRDLVRMPPLAARRRTESTVDQQRVFTESA